MSPQPRFDLQEAVLAFSSAPVIVAITQVLEKLSPLLSANSSHANIVDARDVFSSFRADLERFVQKNMDSHGTDMVIRISGKARRAVIIQPTVQVIVPRTLDTPTESKVSVVESLKPGVSTMKVEVSIQQSGIWKHLLKNFCIICRVTADNAEASFRLANHSPATVKDIVADPNFQPKRCKPSFQLDAPSDSLAIWRFSRPVYRWRPSAPFPSHLTISYDVEHDVRSQVSMSFKRIFNLSDAVAAFSPTPIPVAVSKLLEILSPLLSSDNSIDEQTITTLRSLLTSLASGAKYIFLAVRHGNSALSQVLTVMAASKPYRPASIAERLRLVAERFLFAHANAVDGREVFSKLRADVECVLNSVMENHGQETVIRVSGKNTVEHRGLHAMGLTIKEYVEQAEASCTSMVDMFSGINTMVRAFLEDESFSLESQMPLEEVNFLSPSMSNVWNILRGIFITLLSDLRRSVCRHPSWFQEILKDENGFIDSDEQARIPQITQPTFKIFTPRISDACVNTAASTVESVLTTGTIKSGSCELRLLSVSQIKRGMSTMRVKMSLQQSGIWHHLLKRFSVICLITGASKEPSFRLLNHTPATVNDILADPNLLPKHCKPCFEVDGSASSLTTWRSWRFRRPMYRLRPASIFPSHFNISFDIEHDTRIGVEFQLVFEYRRRSMPIFSDTEQLASGKPYFVDPPTLSADPLPSATPQGGSNVEFP
ncbi:hypothetical protein CVT24_000060 [Panaeolus cyanescens]|uniref:Uncharacterized protein n=1 Tax=Panaeolus cyanescens TaxID=181874 RepID=A0A409VWD4_9AGAR|nr:hypothetical protein CVT24_000060 [Panaeolus cyanescens]